ncbi:type IV pilus biogenesis/stability protein PilW [Lysobacter sp. H21R4]|uniref:type IV pilus biogenesis/stability protein PilW n=1 Tax=Lysobacter sp. H21R4 TaxID=2781021 RepID=UPI0018887A3A|nr:type IV pilus biogenesis/stability protein PilW [Lysobacter sp. H21R4]QOY64020.1 type IV pilus biogenesis/stability protein PilW [Lysobacter sp. H21R4]
MSSRRSGGRALVVVLVAVVLASTACSRLSFVKPKLARSGMDRKAPEVRMTPDSYDSPAAKSRVLIQQGQAALSQGDLTAAAKAADQALRMASDNASAHTLAALVAERKGDSAAAGKHHRRAVDLEPRQGGVANNYGTWLCSNGRAQESLEWFDRALADPGYRTPAIAMANSGACAADAGQEAHAKRYLTGALELDPENPVALGAMAERMFKAGDAFRARAFSQRRLAAAPADWRSLVLASQIEEKLGDREAANRYVQRLGAEFPAVPGSGNGEIGK